jgi:thiol:disulfide interchange protein DsbD
MEAAVWTDPKVKSKIDNDFILVTLMVDEKQQLPAPMQVTERDGTVRTLRTVGDKWSYLQRYKFGANAQPYHVIIDTDGHPMAAPYSYDEDVAKYMKFLNEGTENFNNK